MTHGTATRTERTGPPGSEPLRPAPVDGSGTGPGPRWVVARALARALGALLIVPFQALGQLVRGRHLVEAVRADLATSHAPGATPTPNLPTDRPLRIFLACAEASGEIHALELLDRLREELAAAGAPEPEVTGLGSQRTADRGVVLAGNPVARATMGLGVFKALPFYLGLLRDTAAVFRARRPDVVIGVDSPALHVPMFRIAKEYGLRTVHFVTPQYWGWAPWRVRGYRRGVDLGLSILPFEPAWFGRHDVRAEHVGHPLLDALADVPGGPAEPQHPPHLLLLPGSRESVIRRNLPWMLDRVQACEAELGACQLVLPQDRLELEPLLAELLAEHPLGHRVRLAMGALHPELAQGHLAFCVSGTILLDVLHHRLPMVVIYRLPNRLEAFIGHNLLTVPHFAVVNLLAGAEAVPEYSFAAAGPTAEIEGDLIRLWTPGPDREACLAALERSAENLGPPGATRRAALWVLDEAVRNSEGNT